MWVVARVLYVVAKRLFVWSVTYINVYAVCFVDHNARTSFTRMHHMCNDAVLNYKFLLPKFRFQVFFFFLAQIHTYDLKGNNLFTSELWFSCSHELDQIIFEVYENLCAVTLINPGINHSSALACCTNRITSVCTDGSDVCVCVCVCVCVRSNWPWDVTVFDSAGQTHTLITQTCSNEEDKS